MTLDEVRAFQGDLLRLGYPLPRFGADGLLGAETLHAAGQLAIDRRRVYLPNKAGEVRPNEVSRELGARRLPASLVSLAKTAEPWLRGVDASKWQGEVDWGKVRAAGVRFAWVKATQGRSVTDKTYSRNAAGLRAAGIPHGAYLFWEPETDPAAQAEHFARTVKLLPGDLRPVVDVEKQVKTLTAAEKNARLRAVLEGVERLLGVVPAVYTSARVYREEKLSEGPPRPLWVVWYRIGAAAPPVAPWSDWSVWQTGYGAGMPGVEGPVDRNLLKGGEEGLRALQVG